MWLSQAELSARVETPTKNINDAKSRMFCAINMHMGWYPLNLTSRNQEVQGAKRLYVYLYEIFWYIYIFFFRERESYITVCYI